MKSLLFVSALALSSAAFAQEAPAPAPVQVAAAQAVEATADTVANAPTRLDEKVPLCSKSRQDECVNPSQAPRTHMARAKHGKHAKHMGHRRHATHRHHGHHHAAARARKTGAK